MLEGQWITQAKFAKIVGVSRSAVSQAMDRFAEDNRTPQGFIRYPNALEDWHANRDPRGGGAKRPAAGPIIAPDLVSYDTKPDAPEAPPPPITDADHIKAQPGTLAYERIETMRIKREALQRKAEVEAGRYVPIEDLHMATATIMREFRNVLRTLPSFAEEIAAEKGDLEKVRGKLRIRALELQKVLQEKMTSLAEAAQKGIDPTDAADEADSDDEDI